MIPCSRSFTLQLHMDKSQPAKSASGEEKQDALVRGVSPNSAGSPQCLHVNHRTGVKCKAFAIKGSRTQKCRRHGGAALMGANAPGFRTGRHSRYLPSDLKELYGEAVSNPDILEMSDHLALLETRINSQLKSMADGEPVPRWSNLRATFDDLSTAVLEGDPEATNAKLEAVFRVLDTGEKWDRSWDNVMEAMEQLRKVADTEVKRRRELHLMMPIERVIVLLAAVASAVKRHVTNPHEIMAVQMEIEGLYAGDRTANGKDRMPVGAVDHATRKRQALVRSGAVDAEIVG